MRLKFQSFLPAAYRAGVTLAVLACGLVALKENLASSFADRPFPDAVQDAPHIVRGRIGMTYTEWAVGADGRKRIYTFIELALDEVLKGAIEQKPSIILRSMGGEKDGVGMQISGAARFERGEDVVVFLGPVNDDGTHDVRSMMMGKYNVVKNSRGEEVIEGPGLGGWARRQHSHQSHAGTGDEKEPPESWTLDSLRHLIQEQSGAESPENPNENTASAGRTEPSMNAASGLQNSSEPGHTAHGRDVRHDDVASASAPAEDRGRDEKESSPFSNERSRWTWILIITGILTLFALIRFLLVRAR